MILSLDHFLWERNATILSLDHFSRDLSLEPMQPYMKQELSRLGICVHIRF